MGKRERLRQKLGQLRSRVVLTVGMTPAMPGDPASLLLLAALVLAAAVLYSSVGHAGASGYLAAMTLFGVAPAAMKPAALAMNIVVAVAGTARWSSARLIPWPVLWPLCVTSVPVAFIGGYLALPANVYRPLLGVLLLVAAVRLWLPTVERELHGAPRPVSLAASAWCWGSSRASRASAAASFSRPFSS